MEIINQALEWDSDDSTLLRQFLETRAGTRLLPKVAEQAPTLITEGDTNKILCRTGLVAGVGEAIRIILSLAHPASEENAAATDYPALTDDDKWQDGNKITT